MSESSFKWGADWNRVVMSLNCIPGMGKSGMFLTAEESVSMLIFVVYLNF
jgi:hypothetical protein